MKSIYKTTTRLLILIVGIYLSGCSTFKSFLPDDDSIEYKNTTRQKSLDVPPDLTKPRSNNSMVVPELSEDANTYSAYHGKQGTTASSTVQQPLPEQVGIRYEHEGVNSWLVLKGTKAQVWPRVREFWLKHGFVLVVDQQEQGVLETEWAENRANIPKGAIRKFFGTLFDAAYSSNTRDKFRMRIETSQQENSIELYLTHRGMVERVIGGDLSSEGTAWESAPTDHELEVKMLRRLMVDLGVQKKHAETIIAQGKSSQPKARLIDNENRVTLVLNRDFSRAWRLVGLALDRVSFTVVDRDRSKGIYFVRYNDPDRSSTKKGFLSKLNFWSDDKKVEERLYQVQLSPAPDTVAVVVNDESGKPEASSTAGRILKLLFEQLK